MSIREKCLILESFREVVMNMATKVKRQDGLVFKKITVSLESKCSSNSQLNASLMDKNGM
jgi:hypothetical protein